MNKLTKILATIGPASESEEVIEQLLNAGANVIRFNLKHNDIAWHTERIERVNKVAERIGKTVGILVDLQGPEVRIIMPVPFTEVTAGDHLLVSGETLEPEFAQAMEAGGPKGFSISHLDILEYLEDGQRVVADDGAFNFHVVKKDGKIYLESETTGKLKTRKTLNIPGANFPLPVLVDRDFEAIGMAGRMAADYVALSFVRSKEDLQAVKAEMKKYGVNAKLVAKIETQLALDHLDEIIAETDGVMVARGDLAVESAIEEVPYWQKTMIRKCIEQGKFVITATQMLLSMATNPSPTRAEVSDVANAIYDQTDAIMLSEESAAGAYPVKAVEMMNKIALFTESKRLENEVKKFDFSVNDTTALVCDAAYELYYEYVQSNQVVAGFLVFTQSGRTARLLSRYRAKVPVFAFASNKMVAESMTLNYGVVPFVHEMSQGNEVTRQEVKKVTDELVHKELLRKGSKIIVVHGDHWGVEGGTSTVRIVEV